jgi:hypothetical protein
VAARSAAGASPSEEGEERDNTPPWRQPRSSISARSRSKKEAVPVAARRAAGASPEVVDAGAPSGREGAPVAARSAAEASPTAAKKSETSVAAQGATRVALRAVEAGSPPKRDEGTRAALIAEVGAPQGLGGGHGRPLWPPRRQARRPQRRWTLGRALDRMRR